VMLGMCTSDSTHAVVVQKHCMKTCGKCTAEGCYDHFGASCPTLAGAGLCGHSLMKANLYCKKTCEQCHLEVPTPHPTPAPSPAPTDMCGPGKYKFSWVSTGVESVFCVPCAAGKFTNTSSAGDCTPCANGKYSIKQSPCALPVRRASST
jgi:hypothetical protein